MTPLLLVLVPLRAEAAAVRPPKQAEPRWRVLRTGMGPARARIAAARGLAVEEAVAVAVAGVCAAVSPVLRPGDIVCATELRRDGAEPVEALASVELAEAIRRHGLPVHVGPIYSTDHLGGPDERRGLEQDGVLAIEMESAWLAEAAAGRPLAVLRVVVEPAGRRVVDPRTIPTGIRALVNLRRACPALAEWAGEAARSSVPAAPTRELAAL